MDNYRRDHRAYKFQIAVDVIFHKAVDPAVITQPPVTLTSEMVAVYSGEAPPLADVNRQLVNLAEVYEHNGSGWVFTNFASLQQTLWHLDPLCASASYDGHLIVKSLKNEFDKVRVIPQNLEKYISLSVGQLKFLDYLHFTIQSLDSLVNTLEDDEFRYLEESYTTSHFELIRRKGIYPYDYMNSVDRFEETSLPSQDSFFNKLSGSSCSDSEYAHATRVWDAFGCETIADYHDVYLQLDVLLLADFFEKFRKTCLEIHSLDPLHYYTTPGLAWDAALRMSNVDLQLITDENIYNSVENSIRGGISMISTRHARANNPSFPETFDSSLPNQNLIYLHANNLYGWAMSQFLPTRGF